MHHLRACLVWVAAVLPKQLLPSEHSSSSASGLLLSGRMDCRCEIKGSQRLKSFCVSCTAPQLLSRQAASMLKQCVSGHCRRASVLLLAGLSSLNGSSLMGPQSGSAKQLSSGQLLPSSSSLGQPTKSASTSLSPFESALQRRLLEAARTSWQAEPSSSAPSPEGNSPGSSMRRRGPAFVLPCVLLDHQVEGLSSSDALPAYCKC